MDCFVATLLAMTESIEILFLLAAKRFCDHLVVIFEDDITRPVGSNLGYLISILLKDGDQRTHLGHVLGGCVFDPRYASGSSAVVAF